MRCKRNTDTVIRAVYHKKDRIMSSSDMYIVVSEHAEGKQGVGGFLMLGDR